MTTCHFLVISKPTSFYYSSSLVPFCCGFSDSSWTKSPNEIVEKKGGLRTSSLTDSSAFCFTTLTAYRGIEAMAAVPLATTEAIIAIDFGAVVWRISVQFSSESMVVE